MKTKKYAIALPPEERQQLRSLLRKGKHTAREITRPRILLLADDGQEEQAIAVATGVHFTTVYRVEQHYAENGLAFALSRACSYYVQKGITSQESPVFKR
jgi:uncharacterized membrane protein